MPTIDIDHPHSLGKDRCRQVMDEVARKLAQHYGLGLVAWTGDTLGFGGRGVHGQLVAGEDVAHVHVQLGALAGLMRPVIEAEIRRELHAHLG